MEQLDHQTGKPLERSRNADGRIDFNQNTLGCVNEDLQAPGLVDGRIQQGEKALDEC